MRLLRHDLRLVAGDYHLQRVASDDKGLRPHQRLAIVVDSAESLATNFDDAVAIVVDSAESLATNFTMLLRSLWTLPNRLQRILTLLRSLWTLPNRLQRILTMLGYRHGLRRPRQETTQTATIRQETTQTATIRQETTQTATIRQETTQTATIRQETTSRIAFWTLPDRLPGI